MVAIVPGDVTVTVEEMSVGRGGRGGQVGRTVRVGGRTGRLRPPVHPGGGWPVAGGAGETLQPGGQEAPPAGAGGGGRGGAGESVHVESIFPCVRPQLDGGLSVNIGPEAATIITVATTRHLHRHGHERS